MWLPLNKQNFKITNTFSFLISFPCQWNPWLCPLSSQAAPVKNGRKLGDNLPDYILSLILSPQSGLPDIHKDIHSALEALEKTHRSALKLARHSTMIESHWCAFSTIPIWSQFRKNKCCPTPGPVYVCHAHSTPPGLWNRWDWRLLVKDQSISNFQEFKKNFVLVLDFL